MKRIVLCFSVLALMANAVPAQGFWAPIAGFTDARAGSIAVSIGNKAYVGLGVSDAGYLNDLWEFDPVANKWTKKADMPAPGRQAGIAFAINGKIYAGLGISAPLIVHDDIYEFDPATNTWTSKASFGGGPKYGAMSFSIGNKGYVVGGKDPGFVNGTNDVWEFDPVANTWTQISSAGPVLRSFGIGFSLNGKGYIGLGFENYDTRKKDIWEFDPDFNAWTQKRDFPVARYGPVCFTIGHRAYAGAGYDYTPFSDFYEYNVTEDLWTQVADVSGNGRGQGVAFAIADRGYAGLGYDASGYLSDFYAFDLPRTPAVVFDPISVTTLAGSGPVGEGGFQDGPALSARFDGPVDVAMDAAGNLYVADYGNNRIRKISPDHVVSTYAGSGIPGYADGDALTAQFRGPRGLAVDASGNVLVAEEDGNRIRKITTSGQVTTVAGDGVAGYLDGPALSAQFNRPHDVAIDAEGNLYVADYENQRIRKIAGGTVSTWAGSGEQGETDGTGVNASFAGPQHLAFDNYGSLYVTEIYGSLRKISRTAVVNRLRLPDLYDMFQTGVATDRYGNVYISVNHYINTDAIVKLSPNGNVSVLAGEQAGYKDTIGIYAQFYYALDMTVDNDGNIYTGDGNQRVRKLQKPSLNFLATEGIASAGQYFSISAVNLKANAFLTAPAGFELSLTQGGPYASSLSLSPSWGELNVVPVYIRVAASSTAGALEGNIVLSSDGAETQYLSVKAYVQKPAVVFDPIEVTTYAGTGDPGNTNGSAKTAKFRFPTDVAADASGNVYVADHNNHVIRKINPAGIVSTFAGSGVPGFADGNGTAAQFYHPYGIAVDASGNVYVADKYNFRIRKISPWGMVTTLAGSGVAGFADGPAGTAQFAYPEDVAVDQEGNVFVADQNNHRIRKITPAGIVSTLAGNGSPGMDDGTGTSATFNLPESLAFDPFGNLLVTELYAPLRKITPTGTVSTISTPDFIYGFRYGIVTDSPGNTYIAVTISGVESYVYKVTPSNTGALVAGEETGFKDSIGRYAQFNMAAGMAMGTGGELYVADNSNNRIRRISAPQLSLSSVSGMPSAEKFFSISGVHLTGNIVLTVPTAFEISLTSGTGFASTLSLPPVSAEVTSVPVYIRLKGTAVVGTYNGFVNLSSTGAATQTLAVKGVVARDQVRPTVQCPGAQVFCFNATNMYTVPLLSASDNVGIRNISFRITGATNRTGSGPDASGFFNPGTSVIRWTVTDYSGNASSCATTVRVNNRLTVTIPDTRPLLIWGSANTLYKGFGPTCALLIAQASGGSPYPGFNRYRYSWSTGASTAYASVCPANPGSYTYTVTVTDAQGCTATASKTIKVVDARCGPNNNEVVLCWFGQSQSCYSTWQAIIALYYGAQVGPCNNPAIVTQSQQGKKDLVITPQSEMKVFPNPNKGSFTLAIKDLQVNEIWVLDQSGKLVLKRVVNGISSSQTIEMNLGPVANGMYLVQAIGRNGVYTCKVIVE